MADRFRRTNEVRSVRDPSIDSSIGNYSIEHIPEMAGHDYLGDFFSGFKDQPDRLLISPMVRVGFSRIFNAVEKMTDLVPSTDVFGFLSPDNVDGTDIYRYDVEPRNTVDAMHLISTANLNPSEMPPRILNSGVNFAPHLLSQRRHENTVEVYLSTVAIVEWDISGARQIVATATLGDNETAS